MSPFVLALTTLIFNTPFNTPLQDKIYLTGDFLGCDWRPDCIELDELSPNQWTTTLPLRPGTEFKITRGSWETEAATSTGIALSNFKTPAKDVTHYKDIQNWKDLGPLKVTGNIITLPQFYSPQLDNTRALQIRLPNDYEISNRPYPVIYMHDGQNLFNPRTATFGTDWSVDEVLSAMVSRKEIRDAIIVGIHHKERHHEYNDEDRGRAYGDFVVKTLKPFIDQNFRTLPERENTFLMGSSYGSAISVSMAFRHPQVFGRIAGLSFNASFFSDMLFRLSRSLPMTNTPMYLDYGSRGGDGKFGPHLTRFKEHLKSLGMPPHRLTIRHYPGVNHTESDWARRLHIPLSFLLK